VLGPMLQETQTALEKKIDSNRKKHDIGPLVRLCKYTGSYGPKTNRS